MDASLADAAAGLRVTAVASLFDGLNSLGDPLTWAILVVVVAGPLAAVDRGAALLMLATLLSEVVTFSFKVLFARSRPEGADLLDILGNESFAFPSGHVVRAVAFVAVLGLIAGRRTRGSGHAFAIGAAAGFAAGILMGIARVAEGVHWPSDALGGLFLGLAWFGGIVAVAARPNGLPRYSADG